MKNLLLTEESAQFVLCLFLLIFQDVPWWCYVLLLIGPDFSMIGYLLGPKVGAISYNIAHHKGLALAFIGLGLALGYLQKDLSGLTFEYAWLFLTGIILYGHASMDRVFGFGLKFSDSFQHTHLGWIGKVNNKQEQEAT